MEQISVLGDADHTCRTCLRKGEQSNSLYDLVEYDECIELKVLLMRVTGVEVDKTEPLPTRICVQCTDKLLEAYDFVIGVDKSEEFYRHKFKADATVDDTDENTNDIEVAELVAQPEPFAPVEEADNKADRGDDIDPVCFEFLESDYQQLMHDSCVETTTEDVKNEDAAKQSEEEIHIEQVNLKKIDRRRKQRTSSVSDDTQHVRTKRLKLGSRLGIYETSNWHKCLKCQRSFAKKETLEKHIRLVHTYAPIEKILAAAPKPTAEQPLQCTECPRIFMRKDNLHRHMVAMHPDVNISEDRQRETKKNYKRGLCPFCGESFTQASLIIHIRRHTGETPYICSECGKGFPRRQDMVIHQRQHSGEKPLVCTICGKTFVRPNKLSRHMRIHTGVRPYKCSECDKCFTQSNDLKLHLRRHTGEKPYKCDVCNDSFISGTALKKHRQLKLHHEKFESSTDPYATIRVNSRQNRMPHLQSVDAKAEPECAGDN